MYEHIAKNRAKTVLIIIGFVFMLSLIGYFIGVYFDYRYGMGTTYSVALMIVALAVALFASFGSYYFSDRIVLSMTGAKPILRDDDPRVYYMVEGLSIAAGLPMPAIYIIYDQGMNAFATGRNPKKGVIVFTRGLLDNLNDEELKGVISHELAHIKNYDILLGTIIVVLVGTVSIIANIMARLFLFGGRGRRSARSSRSGGILMIALLVIGIVFIIISPVVATVIKMALSRNREYLADSTGALISRYPPGLASALKKISRHSEVRTASSATAHLFISNPLGEKSRVMFKSLFNSHPPIKERIERLNEMSLGVLTK
ncbi:MAG: M48 family metallopeptidase [Actinomycetia bacterium]|nr:M48 family metallopeptidase [Actinomycetes bacterium]